MTKRRTYNWPQLLNDFSQSNLSQAEFCKQREINPTYFSLKLSKRKALETGAFAKVEHVKKASKIFLTISSCSTIQLGGMETTMDFHQPTMKRAIL